MRQITNPYLDFGNEIIARHSGLGYYYDTLALIHPEYEEENVERPQQHIDVTNITHLQVLKEYNQLFQNNITFLTQIVHRAAMEQIYPSFEVRVEKKISELLPLAEKEITGSITQQYLTLKSEEESRNLTVLEQILQEKQVTTQLPEKQILQTIRNIENYERSYKPARVNTDHINLNNRTKEIVQTEALTVNHHNKIEMINQFDHGESNLVYHDTSELLTQQIRQDVQEHIQRNVKEQIRQNVQERIRQDVQEHIQRNVQEQIRQNVQKHVQQNVQEQIQRNVKEQIRQNVQEHIQQDVQEQIRQDVQEHIQRNVQEKIRQDVQKHIQQDVQEQIQQDVQEHIQRNVQEKIQQDVQEHIQQDVQEQIRQDVQKHIQQDVQQQIQQSVQEQIRQDIQEHIRRSVQEDIRQNAQEHDRQKQQWRGPSLSKDIIKRISNFVSPAERLEHKYINNRITNMVNHHSEAQMVNETGQQVMQPENKLIKQQTTQIVNAVSPQVPQQHIQQNNLQATKQHIQQNNPQATQQHIRQNNLQATQQHIQQNNLQATQQHIQQNNLQVTQQHIQQNNLQVIQQHIQQNNLQATQQHIQQNKPQVTRQHIQQNSQQVTRQHIQQNNLQVIQQHIQQNNLQATQQHIQQNKPQVTRQHIQQNSQQVTRQHIHQNSPQVIQQNNPRITQQNRIAAAPMTHQNSQQITMRMPSSSLGTADQNIHGKKQAVLLPVELVYEAKPDGNKEEIRTQIEKEQKKMSEGTVREVVKDIEFVKETKKIVQNQVQEKIWNQEMPDDADIIWKSTEKENRRVMEQLQKSIDRKVDESVGQIADRVYRHLEERLRSERNRRGY